MVLQYCGGCYKNLGEYEEDSSEDVRHCRKCVKERMEESN